MKTVLKSAMAVLLAAVLLLGAIGCSSGDQTWSAKSGDTTLSIGSYIYFLAVASSDAAKLVEDSDQPVLKQTVEGEDAETWIRNKAEYYVKYYFAILKMMNDRGITLTEEEKNAAATQAAYYWNQSSSQMEGYGIALASYTMATAEQSQMITKLFQNIYGKGGEKEVPDSDLQTYFEDNYASYAYLAQYLFTYGEDGKATAMDDDQKAAVKKELEGYIERYNNGSMTLDEVVEAYKKTEYYQALHTDDTESTEVLKESVEKLTEDSTIGAAVLGIEAGKAALADLSGSGAYYVVFRHDIKEKTAEWLADETDRNELLSGLKNEEFQAMVEDEIASVEVEFNTGAMQAQKVSKFFK